MRPTPRSVLFAPGLEERKIARAISCGCDLAIADLEDSVREADKERARGVVEAALSAAPATAAVAIRVNGADTPHIAEDLALTARLRLAAVVLPKASAEGVRAVAEQVDVPVLPIVETACGLEECAAIARADRVWTLVLGGVDLARELRLVPRRDGLELLFARSALVTHCAAARIAAPIDTVHTAVADVEGLVSEATLARSLGFGGKACIHPAQVAHVRAAFSPTGDELTWARRVVDGFEAAESAGSGVIEIDGEMVDLPVYERAVHLMTMREGGGG
jgi:citrate lyase subunit beta/citryl-CoA lyase